MDKDLHNLQKKHHKKRGKTLVKKITGWLHLWLGLISGLIVFVVVLSGTLFVFCDEIIDFVAGSDKYIEYREGQQKIDADVLIAQFNAKHKEEGRKAFYIDEYKDPERSFRIASGIKRGGFSYTYINPYTGNEIGSTMSYRFFYVVAHIHSQLLLGGFGKTVVGISSIIFFIQLLGGLILWWPQKWTKATRTSSFKFKRGVKWKRRNYDLHNVLGFYVVIPAIFVTITGLIMAYEVLESFTQKTFGGVPAVEARKLSKKYEPPFVEGKDFITMQDAIDITRIRHPENNQVRVSFFGGDDSTIYSILVGKFIGVKSAIDGHDITLNRYTGNEIEMPEILENHEKIEHTNFDLHVGYWGGYIGKTITFIVGIICSSLPITGVLIWWGRRNKKKPVAVVK
ncbi:TPA: PepSY domain-containing protein [Elizabethkingia anophelis]|nr:PepSY-associated TM helix domain-containing protein [Elizabethkingia anophelis]MCT4323771.1 PepSY domain-containing protein [Elizabethkingia anophelis]HAY3536167.1 PepSY domain-containing protein [Elizabethkingia anophelis]HAY3548384.1 PepSY domain-containing protein [Elizabethkingia anophelis]HAY3593128.1 PepSY domain-containing protein [Elizabethkingia anophelis]